jgi:nuclear pore complex protein Nup155
MCLLAHLHIFPEVVFQMNFSINNDQANVHLNLLFQLVLVGVCYSASTDGKDPYADLSLQPLPEYIIATDGVTMTCITCTDKGQIFLAGRDGHIYELQHTTGSGWRKRCRKVCLTTGIGSLLSRYVLL